MAVIPYEDKQYQQSQQVTNAQTALQQHQQKQPGQYQSQYQPQMNNLMNQYQNRGKFQYDLNADALYQQAAQRYIQQGQQAMMDTMGQAAMLTGGYGNSYAQSVGQQTYQGYLQGLNDQIPQYYNMALNRYQMEGDDMLNRYNMLANAEAQEYGRYMDNLNQYYQQLDRLQGVYDSERNFDYSQYENNRNFEYGKYQDDLGWQYKADRDAVADDQWAQQWAYQQERDRIADEQWQKQFDENVRQFNESLAARESGGSGGGVYKYKEKDETPANVSGYAIANATITYDRQKNLGLSEAAKNASTAKTINDAYAAKKIDAWDAQALRDIWL